MLKNLFPFMDADGAGTGVATAQDSAEDAAQTNSQAQPESGQEGADERKTGDAKSEAQKIADAMVAKRLKGLDRETIELFKENKDKFLQFIDSQKSEAERIAAAQRKAEKAEADATAKEAKANAMIAAVGAGIMAGHIEDAVILAAARVSDDTSIEDAIKVVAKNNPAWVAGVNLPGNGGNPAKDAEEKKEPPILI